MRYAQLVMGPAGCGKSTYCNMMAEHCQSIKRMVHVVNLDPAAETFTYQPFADVRELISIDDVMEDEDLKLGPNGGLVFCMEFLVANFSWLEEQLGEVEDDYILFDCPGQIELYTHMSVMRQLVEHLRRMNFNVCAVFILDSQFLVDVSKFYSGCLVALSAMVNLEAPHVNLLSKMDLLDAGSRRDIERYLEPDLELVEREVHDTAGTAWRDKYNKLTRIIANLLHDFSLVRLIPLDMTDEESVNDVLLQIDTCIQYGEDLEPRIVYPEEGDEDG